MHLTVHDSTLEHWTACILHITVLMAREHRQWMITLLLRSSEAAKVAL
jgi:hypothetical protein